MFKFLFIVCCVHVVLAVDIKLNHISRDSISVYNYHRNIGVPKAIQIKEYEDRIYKQRIVGGFGIDIKQTPYQAGIIIPISQNLSSVCGGALISDNTIVTAAHCFDDGVTVVTRCTLILGSTFLFYGGERFVTSDILVHPGWNIETVTDDIALIRIDRVIFSELISPVTLPSGTELHQDYTSFLATASGYGLTGDGKDVLMEQQLHVVFIKIISNEECELKFGDFVRDATICTSGMAGTGTCSGDSGGPLVINSNGRDVLVGITSFGDAAGCETGSPSGYTRVSAYLFWILANTSI